MTSFFQRLQTLAQDLEWFKGQVTQCYRLSSSEQPQNKHLHAYFPFGRRPFCFTFALALSRRTDRSVATRPWSLTSRALPLLRRVFLVQVTLGEQTGQPLLLFWTQGDKGQAELPLSRPSDHCEFHFQRRDFTRHSNAQLQFCPWLDTRRARHPTPLERYLLNHPFSCHHGDGREAAAIAHAATWMLSTFHNRPPPRPASCTARSHSLRGVFSAGHSWDRFAVHLVSLAACFSKHSLTDTGVLWNSG